MDSYGVQRAVFDAIRGVGGQDCTCRSASRSGPTPRETELLSNRDVRGLAKAGVHPVLINAYARSIGMTRDEYRVLLAGPLHQNDTETRWQK